MIQLASWKTHSRGSLLAQTSCSWKCSLTLLCRSQHALPQVVFMPQDSSLLNNTFILTARLPPSFNEFHTTTYDIVCKVGPLVLSSGID
jgi:hypothetical protein